MYEVIYRRKNGMRVTVVVGLFDSDLAVAAAELSDKEWDRLISVRNAHCEVWFIVESY